MPRTLTRLDPHFSPFFLFSSFLETLIKIEVGEIIEVGLKTKLPLVLFIITTPVVLSI